MEDGSLLQLTCIMDLLVGLPIYQKTRSTQKIMKLSGLLHERKKHTVIWAIMFRTEICAKKIFLI